MLNSGSLEDDFELIDSFYNASKEKDKKVDEKTANKLDHQYYVINNLSQENAIRKRKCRRNNLSKVKIAVEGLDVCLDLMNE